MSQLDSRHKLHDTNRGNFKTPLQAKKARDALIYEWKHMPLADTGNEKIDLTKTFKDVFDDYLRIEPLKKERPQFANICRFGIIILRGFLGIKSCQMFPKRTWKTIF